MRNKRIGNHLADGGFPHTVIGSLWPIALLRRFFSSARFGSSLILFLLITGCESTPHPAPVIDRPIVESQEVINKTGIISGAADQHPNFYTVQKGDTLYSIARSHGIDLQDLAERNNVQDAGALHIGQQLNLSLPSQLTQPSLFPIPEPALPSTAIAVVPNTVPLSGEKPVINTDKLKVEPKAFKLPYSEMAVAQLKGLAATPPIVIAKAEPAIEKKTDTEMSSGPSPLEVIPGDDRIEWTWPTKGKVLEGFTEGTKGIDIAGKSGQSVTASAAGKVVYSGAGLRGYGKLIIIKHNNTYLSAYAHNNKILVKEGQTVDKGQKIAEMGDTDTHLIKLHFEIRKNGKPVDPLKYLPGISG
jgi:lipoprotein NlpD